MTYGMREKGSVMVEASIYFPLVLCTVMAMIYLALMNMQEYMLMYQAQRIAYVAARETAYPGYEEFGMGAGNEIDFDWGEGNTPSEEKITSYYKVYHSGIGELYREISGWFANREGVAKNYAQTYGNEVRSAALFALGTISEPDVEIDKGLLGTNVTVTITYKIPMPGALKYLGLKGDLGVKSSAYTFSENPAGFVRNVDLASDCTSYIFEKLGMEQKFEDFKQKTKKVIDTIL